jgi:phage terminase large subunit
MMSDEALSVGITKEEPKHQALGTYEIIIPKVYAPLWTDKDHNKFLLSSGRCSGKTSILVDLIYSTINQMPDYDIVILQATSAEIKTSIINEVVAFFTNKGFDIGDKPTNEIYVPKSQDRVIFNDGAHKGGIYIFPITDSKGGQRARGIKTPNPISLVLFEEVQKNKDANVVEQALATFVRQTTTGMKIVIVGNNETLGHWFTSWSAKKRKDKEWCYIYASYLDIWTLINKEMQDYILNFKRTDPQEYRRMYLGDVRATVNDKVFPQFVRGIHYKLAKDLEVKNILRVIIGIDHATANDKFAVVPLAILSDGTCQTLQVCVDDPQETQRSLAPTEQCEILDDFLEYLDEEYGFTYNQTKIYMSVDGAASPFIAQLRHTKKTSHNKIWRGIRIFKFTQKKKDYNMGIIKSAFALNVIKILNEGKWEWNGARNHHWLCHELEAQRYKNGKLDPAIPNDVVDALEYAMIPYYTNCFNLSWPIRANEINMLNEMHQRMNDYKK